MNDDRDVGSLGEEAARLMAAVQHWANRASAHAPIATGAPECEWCPICQIIAVIRGDRPDLAEKAGDTVHAVVDALVAVFSNPRAAHPHRADPHSGAAGAANPAGNGTAPSSKRIQRIDLSGSDRRSGEGNAVGEGNLDEGNPVDEPRRAGEDTE